jgi:hypothetical protein
VLDAARRRPHPKHAVTESFKNSRLVCGTMPFQNYAVHFGPEQLATMQAAFDATWEELRAAGVDLSTEDKVTHMKTKLAHRILVSATAGGVRDLETLKEQALRSLAGGLRVSGSQTGASEAA